MGGKVFPAAVISSLSGKCLEGEVTLAKAHNCFSTLGKLS